MHVSDVESRGLIETEPGTRPRLWRRSPRPRGEHGRQRIVHRCLDTYIFSAMSFNPYPIVNERGATVGQCSQEVGAHGTAVTYQKQPPSGRTCAWLSIAVRGTKRPSPTESAVACTLLHNMYNNNKNHLVGSARMESESDVYTWTWPRPGGARPRTYTLNSIP